MKYLLEFIKGTQTWVKAELLEKHPKTNILEAGEESVNKIKTNMPFGIREKSHEANIKIYNDFVQLATRILAKGGLAVLFTQEIKLVQEVFGQSGFLKLGDYSIKQGGLKTPYFRL